MGSLRNCDVGIENSDWSNYFTEDFYIPKEVYDALVDYEFSIENDKNYTVA